MDHKTLIAHSQYIKHSGFVLNSQEKTALQSSLVLLQQDYHFHKVVYWGKIFGIKNDYHIAQGYKGSVLEKRVTCYSIDGGVTWNQLASPPESELRYLVKIRGRFMGDPSYQYKFEKIYFEGEKEEEERLERERLAALEAEKKKKEEEEKKRKEEELKRLQQEAIERGEEPPQELPEEEKEEEEQAEEDKEENKEEQPKKKPPEIVSVLEEVRLSYVIECIDKDTSVAPRGAFVLKADQNIVPNDTFQGLDRNQASNLSYYFHLRKPETLNNKTMLQREQMNKALDFADTIDEDIPNRCWAMSYIDSYNLILLRSLLWPGYVFYIIPNSTTWGAYYFGTGEKNLDLCFML